MKKLKEMAAISLFTLLAVGFSASAMADAQTSTKVLAAKVSHNVHWCALFDPNGMEFTPLPDMGWPWCF